MGLRNFQSQLNPTLLGKWLCNFCLWHKFCCLYQIPYRPFACRCEQ